MLQTTMGVKSVRWLLKVVSVVHVVVLHGESDCFEASRSVVMSCFHPVHLILLHESFQNNVATCNLDGQKKYKFPFMLISFAQHGAFRKGCLTL